MINVALLSVTALLIAFGLLGMVMSDSIMDIQEAGAQKNTGDITAASEGQPFGGEKTGTVTVDSEDYVNNGDQPGEYNALIIPEAFGQEQEEETITFTCTEALFLTDAATFGIESGKRLLDEYGVTDKNVIGTLTVNEVTNDALKERIEATCG